MTWQCIHNQVEKARYLLLALPINVPGTFFNRRSTFSHNFHLLPTHTASCQCKKNFFTNGKGLGLTEQHIAHDDVSISNEIMTSFLISCVFPPMLHSTVQLNQKNTKI